jgi:hypothetical protein
MKVSECHRKSDRPAPMACRKGITDRPPRVLNGCHRALQTRKTDEIVAAPKPSAPRFPRGPEHRLIVPCLHDQRRQRRKRVSRLVAVRSMCLAIALDKAFENIDCVSAILRCYARNRFYDSTQRLIGPRPVLRMTIIYDSLVLLHHKFFRRDRVIIGAEQHGHRGSVRTRAAMRRRRMVAIEFGI